MSANYRESEHTIPTPPVSPVTNVPDPASDERESLLAQLRAEHAQKLEILESISDIFYAVDENFHFTYVNNRAEEAWGRRREDLLGKHYWTEFPDAVGSESYHMHLKVMSERQPVQYETISPLLNRWITASIYPGDGGGLAVYFQDISDRKRTEIALHEANRRMADMLDSGSDAMMGIDRDWRVIYVSREAERLLRLRREEVLGRVLWEAQPALVGTQAEVYARRVMEERVPLTFESYQEPLDTWVETRVFPTDDGIAILGRDISGSKKAELALSESDSKYRLIVETTREGIWQIGDGGHTIYANPRMAEMLGCTLSELQESVLSDFTFEEDRPAIEASRVRHIAGEGELHELRLRRKDGTTIWTHLSTNPVLDRQGEFAGAVGMFTDITEHKKAQDALRQSEERYRLFIESYPQFVWASAPDGTVKYYNSYWYEYTGMVPHEDVMEGWLHVLHPDDRERTLACWEEARQSGEEYEIEYRFRRAADSTYRWFLGRLSPILGADGQIAEWHGTAVDIEERKRAEANLALLAEVSADFAPLLRTDELMSQVGEKLGRHLDLSRCTFSYIDEDADLLSARYEWRRDDVPSTLGDHPISGFLNENGRKSYWAGELTVVNDVNNAPLTSGSPELFAAIGVGSVIDVPYLEDGRWRFLLTVSRAKPSVWRPDEIELVRELAARIWARLGRAQAEEALRASEEKYRTLFESIDEGVTTIEMIFDENDKAVDYRFIETNPAVTQMTGLTAEVIGKRISEVVPNLEPVWLETYGQVANTGEAARLEHRVAGLQDQWFDVYAARVGGEGSRRVVTVYNNITERKRRELHQALLVQISDDSSQRVTPDEIMQAVGSRLGNYLNLGVCVFGDVDEERDEVTLHHGWHKEGVPNLKQTYRMTEYMTDDFARACRAGELFIVSNTATDARVDADAYASLDIGAWLTVPFRQEGRWTSFLTVTDVAPRDWRHDEIELVRNIADRVLPCIERARTEAALRESEALLAAVFESLPVGVGAVDARGKLVLSNKEMHRFLPTGVVPSLDAERSTRWLAYDPDGRRIAPPDFPCARALRGERVVPGVEMLYTQDDGTEVWTRVSAVAIRDAEGQVTGQVFAVTDIDTLKRGAEALRRSEEEYRTLFESMDEGFCLLERVDGADPIDFRYVEANPGFEAQIGTGNVVGKTIREIFPGAPEQGYEIYERVWRTGEPVRAELDVSSMGYVIDLYAFRMEGEPSRVAVIFQDVTKRKRSEAMLRASEERFRAVADLVPDLLWSNDTNGSTMWYNQRWYEYTGQTPTEAADYGWLHAIHPEDRERSYTNFQDAVDAGQALRQTHRIRGAHGEYRWFIVQAQPIRDETGKIVRWFGAATDIQEEQEAQEALERRVEARTAELYDLNARLRQMSLRLLEVQEAERRLIARELHDEIGQYLTGLDFMLELAQRREGYSNSGRIAEARNIVTDLVGRVRDTSLNLRPSILDDMGLLPALVWHIGRYESQTGIQVDLRHQGLEQRLPHETETAVYRLVQESLTNSARHSRANNIKIDILVDGIVALRVHDNGMGFDVEQVIAARRSAGLSGMRERVELLGGNISIESASGEGTTLIAEIPKE